MDTVSDKLTHTPEKQLFISYLVPSVLGMMLMSVNILVDGIFVSNGVGPEALAGVNIAVPVYSILLSISLWIGIGGATLYSIAAGRGDVKEARAVFNQSLAWTVIIVGVLIVLCVWQERKLAILFGADDKILPFVLDYLHIILVFGLVYVLENILSIFIRNDGNPRLAMAGLITNSLLNIVLNYVFIFVLGWGIKGAAYATVLATWIGIFVMAIHFFRKDSQLGFMRVWLKAKKLREVLGIGLPSFIAEGSAAVTTIGYNVTFMHFVGQLGVTAFAVVNYLHAVFIMIFIAIGSSIQPLVSFHYGAGLFDRLKKFLVYAIRTGFGIGLFIFASCFFFGDWLTHLFGVTKGAVWRYTVEGLVLFSVGYVFLSYNMVCAEYYQSMKQIRLSTVIILLRSLIFFIPLLVLLPLIFGNAAIWLAFPIAECLTAGAVYWLGKRQRIPSVS